MGKHRVQERKRRGSLERRRRMMERVNWDRIFKEIHSRERIMSRVSIVGIEALDVLLMSTSKLPKLLRLGLVAELSKNVA